MECHEIPKDPASELLSSEDFSRLNETAPRLMRALADRAGTSVSNLRKMADEGRLTSAALLYGVNMKPHGAAAMNAEQAQSQAGSAAASTAAAIASAGVARAAATCACTRKGCPACDMLAKEHPGEAIVPATLNPWPEALTLGREIVRLNTRIAQLLARWDGDGVPQVRGH
ncbi:hypothetical protein BFJ72_g14891 [Fusarium proliferatum]|uniref:Uncharacterized protein n=1 Tax=Gibberella intermedia TaxID=948311 RepID=A0A420RWR5_GIBIN|nr:hypothetical protein BFJ72_g14891 [Fusarium proliferatum]